MALYRGALRPWLKDSRDFLRRTRQISVFRRHRNQFRDSIKASTVDWDFGNDYPCLDDFGDSAGVAKGHYFHQDLYVAQCIYSDKPERHLDVGSRIDGFVAHVATYREIDVADIRPIDSKVRNIRFHQVNFMNLDAVKRLGTWPSVSCLHALEHFGLGRYGDPVDPDGWLTGLKSLATVVNEGGLLYLSVPIGIQRIEFNARTAENWFEFCGFSYVNDEGDFFSLGSVAEGQMPADIKKMDYGCGIFTFRKK
jgi:hypothetical protein